ncbi:scavenger mRNA decapping enzyme [Pleurotus eryngii]|uniref:Scavenger mRNA decapping enzyme n=1 Tax=Pleurotus eryngii TaxID=5323 RepID=A0A9P5ZZ90_PLEER|nr:scavenger mRNA decapping enzyme [Pleurotus eryngii]
MKQISLEDLQTFEFQSILNEDPLGKNITLLGSFARGSVGPSQPTQDGERDRAIVRIGKTAFDLENIKNPFVGLIERIEAVESTDIYIWLLGWFATNRDRDVKIDLICPATDVHIRKYTEQQIIMVRETPEIYEAVVKPYIAAFPAARTKWVDDILSGLSEADKVLYNCLDFIILPDMKWDLTTMSAFYILAIARDASIRSLRDLAKNRGHVQLLKSIRTEAGRVAQERFGLQSDRLRMFVHYQPSYYRFHVHIVHANHVGTLGSTIGQAHLLDDIISLLELEVDDQSGIFERTTLTYGLGDQHGLLGLIQQYKTVTDGGA